MKAPARLHKGPDATGPRNEADCRHELSIIDQAHIQNETGRDAFLALAHTALFAASVAFVGNLAHAGDARLIYLLVGAWLASVVGLLALTTSFHDAGRHINRRREQLYLEVAEEPGRTAILNAIALWSFPFALVLTFVFATANVLAR